MVGSAAVSTSVAVCERRVCLVLRTATGLVALLSESDWLWIVCTVVFVVVVFGSDSSSSELSSVSSFLAFLLRVLVEVEVRCLLVLVVAGFFGDLEVFSLGGDLF